MKNTSDLRKDFHEFKPIVKIYDPCINQASESFVLPSYDSEGVMVGFGAIKGMGSVAEEIVKRRPYPSMADFLKRVKLDKTQLTCLIYAGAFDVFEKDKAVLLGNMERILKFSKTPHSDVIDLFDPGEVFKLNRALLGKVPDPGKMEMACYGFNIKYGFINENRWMVDNLEPHHVVGTVTEIKRTKTKKDKRDMAIVSLDTSKGLVKALLFYENYVKYNSLLEEEKTYAFTGQLKVDPEPSLFVSKMNEEWNIKVTRANLISDNFDKAIFDGVVDEAEIGDAVISVSNSEHHIMNHNKKIIYDERIHTKLVNAGFAVKLEVFEARMIE
jgi:DNA polymerase III alpha subunit